MDNRDLADRALIALRSKAAPEREIIDAIIRETADSIVSVCEVERSRHSDAEGAALARTIDRVRRKFAL